MKGIFNDQRNCYAECRQIDASKQKIKEILQRMDFENTREKEYIEENIRSILQECDNLKRELYNRKVL